MDLTPGERPGAGTHSGALVGIDRRLLLAREVAGIPRRQARRSGAGRVWLR